MSLLDIVCANLFLSVDISLLLRIVFTLKIKKFEWRNVINLTHFSQYIAFSWKTKGDWGNSCKHICHHKELIIIPFKIYLESFSIQKLLIFLIFSLPINAEKVIFLWVTSEKIKATVELLKETSYMKQVLNFVWPFQRFGRLLREGASPCTCKHSSSSSKKNVLKAFLISRSIVNKPLNCRNMY